jgi:hypothetical protein
MPAIKNDAALLGADTLPAKIPAGGPPALVRIPPEGVFPRVPHRPCSEINDKDIAAPIARSALSAKGGSGVLQKRSEHWGRSGAGGVGETRNSVAVDTTVSAMVSFHHGIPVFTGNDRSSRHPTACSPGGMRDVRGVSRAAKGADLNPLRYPS